MTPERSFPSARDDEEGRGSQIILTNQPITGCTERFNATRYASLYFRSLQTTEKDDDNGGDDVYSETNPCSYNGSGSSRLVALFGRGQDPGRRRLPPVFALALFLAVGRKERTNRSAVIGKRFCVY